MNSRPTQSVVSAAFIITLAGLASRFLGLIRDRLLASTFGAGDVLDAYYASFRIPDLIYNLLILGALSAAFIPVFTSLISKNKEKEAWKMTNGMLNLAVVIIFILGIILGIFAPFLMKLQVPGFSGEKMDLTVHFTRIMFLSPLLLGISGIFGGVLTSFKKFMIYSLAPLFYNLGIIFGILFFVRFMGPSGLAWGVVLGAFLHMLIQYLAVKNSGFHFNFSFFESIKDIYVRRVVRLMIPRTLGIAANQMNLVLLTFFASTLASGSLSIFSLAQNLQAVPMGIFGSSFAIAVFPTLAVFFSKNETEKFVESFSRTFRQILFFVIPTSVFMLVLRAQIVRVFLGSGKFDWEDTILTFQCLGIFSLSLFAQSLIPLLARSFFAMHDTKTPFYIALFSEAVTIGIIFLLIGKYQIIGLAIAFSVASVLQMALLLFVLRFKMGNLGDKKIISFVCRISLVSLFAGIFVQLGKYAVMNFMDIDTFVGIFAQLAVSSIFGLIIFIVLSQLLKIEEFIYFKNLAFRKLLRQKVEISEDLDDVSGM